MFGYIGINMDELKIKDYKTYRGFYCGLCQELKEKCGQCSRLTLTYDMTFLAILLTGLYETEVVKEQRRCALHPVKKHLCIRNEAVTYAAEMNLLISYYNLRDDWEDERKVPALALSQTMKKKKKQLEAKYPRQASAIHEYLHKLKNCEAENSTDLDRASTDTGVLFGEIYAWKDDLWSDTLKNIGFYIGKFIYLMDAYDDIEKDLKKGNYNPWASVYPESDFHEFALQVLTMVAAECSKNFERLPIVEYVDILRNILYSGIWVKCETNRNNEEKK